nr:hypothetical protein [Cellulomonas aerilata]
MGRITPRLGERAVPRGERGVAERVHRTAPDGRPRPGAVQGRRDAGEGRHRPHRPGRCAVGQPDKRVELAQGGGEQRQERVRHRAHADRDDRLRDAGRRGGDQGTQLGRLTQHQVGTPGVEDPREPRPGRVRVQPSEDVGGDDLVRLLERQGRQAGEDRRHAVGGRVGEGTVLEPGRGHGAGEGRGRGHHHLVTRHLARPREGDQGTQIARARRRRNQHAHLA